MAISALYAIRNGEATFYAAGTTSTIDERTGNVVFASEELTYKLHVTTELDPEIASLPGVNNYDRALQCYAVSPKKLDSRIIPGTKCEVTFGGVTSSGVVRHIHFPYGNADFGALLNNVLGDSILIEQFWRS